MKRKDGSWRREERKKGRTRTNGLNAPIILSPLPIAQSPPPGFPSSKYHVLPLKNRTSLATGSGLAGGSQSKALHSALPEILGSVSAAGSQSKELHCTVSENLASGAHNLMVCPEPEVEYNIRMEIEEINTARQAQRHTSRFTSTITELCSTYETTTKKNEELVKQVADLEGQIQNLKELKASWDDNKKELERERDEARKEALSAFCEKRDIEEKLQKAAKQVDDVKAASKMAIDNAAASTIMYKAGIRNFVAHLASGEGKLLGDYVNDLVKEKPC